MGIGEEGEGRRGVEVDGGVGIDGLKVEVRERV